MSAPAPQGECRPGRYTWSGGEEALLRFGPDTGPLVIAALPLFEEANRTRALTVAILRALAVRGIASLLPDFPGTGDSLLATSDTTVIKMREAYLGLVDGLPDTRIHAVGIRSGALLDTFALLDSRWHLAPQTGPDVLRDLRRIRQASGAEDYAGNDLSEDMLADLEGVLPFNADESANVRTIRLETDPRPADLKFPGAPLWRRAEPGNDLALAERLAGDIADWIASCDA